MDVQPRGIVATYRAADAVEVGHIAQSLCQPPGYIIMADTTEVQFLSLAEPLRANEWPTWDEARFFCDAFELRWQRLANGQFTLLLLTEACKYVPSHWERWPERWHAVEHEGHDALRLWGKRQASVPQWVEVRIPRLLSYPVPLSQESVSLRWIEYYDAQGTPRLSRLKGVSDATHHA